MEDSPGDAPESATENPPVGRSEGRSARTRTFLPDVTGVEFSHSRRGYDRDQVDRYVERVSRIVVELEAMRSPDAVIERALADVGEETSAILRRARKAAEEIVDEAESHAQETIAAAEAEGGQTAQEADDYRERIRAEADRALAEATARGEHTTAEAAGEARRIRDEADDYRKQVLTHIEQIAQERQRLIEDLRKLSDSFRRAADRADEQNPVRESGYEGVNGNDAGVAEPRSA